MTVIRTMTDEERLIFRGLQARDQLLQQAMEELGSDRRFACEQLAQRLGVPVADLGGRIRLDPQRGLIRSESIGTDEETDNVA